MERHIWSGVLKEKFKLDDIYFDFDRLIKKYDIKKNKNLTIAQVESDLRQFVQILKLEEFEPAENE